MVALCYCYYIWVTVAVWYPERRPLSQGSLDWQALPKKGSGLLPGPAPLPAVGVPGYIIQYEVLCGY